MLLVLMQNGWSTHYTRIGRPGEFGDGYQEFKRSWEAKVWTRERWIDATWACKTGRMLRIVLEGVPHGEIWLDDTTLELAPRASGVRPPDLDHVEAVISNRDIRTVLACGKQAGDTIDRCWSGPLVKMPHPAYRGLTPGGVRMAHECVKTMRSEAARGAAFRVETFADKGFRVLDGCDLTEFEEAADAAGLNRKGNP